MKNSKVKGSVLYTVISVMMIVIVLIFAALALASSSGKRAVNTYADKQTQFTARSVVESIYKSLETNSEFSDSFSSIPKHSSINISVSLPDPSMGSVVKATVTNIGNGNELGYDSEKPVYKISASVSMNGKENTVAMYVLADYEKRNAPYLYSVSTLDSLSLNNLQVVGGAVSSIINKESALKENFAFNGFLGINGDLRLTGSSQMNFLSPETGMYINGNLTLENIGEKLNSEVHKVVAYDELPYIYVEDNLHLGKGSSFSAGGLDSPFILYSGTVSNYGDNSIYGDIYLLDEHKLKDNVEYGVSEFVVNESNKGSFYSWDKGLIKKVNGNGSSYLGGNIYSKGKILVRGTSSDNGYILANDVVSSELEISADKVSVNGSVVILDELFFSASEKGEYYFKNGLFVDPDKLRIECPDIIINSVHNDGTTVDAAEFIKNINAYSFFINGGVIYIDNIDQSIKIELLDKSGYINADPTQADSIRISSALLFDENEKAVSYIEDKKYNYQKEYKKFLKDIVHNYGNMFPASMEREYLKSSRLKDNNLLDSDSVLNIMNNSKSSTDINSTVNFNDLPLYYINFGSLYKNYKNSIGEVVIERAALNDESKAITDSCTLIGDLPNDTMYINPGDKDIWIRLINFHGQSGFKIIVDDSGTGKVNFFVPGAGEFINYFRTNKDIITVNIQNFEWWSDYVYSDGNVKLEDTWILTKTYADCFKEGKFEIMKNPNLFNEGERKMIPNINVYMDAEFDGDFNFWGKSAVTGYVMSPTAYLNQSGTPPLLDIKYNSNNYMPINTGFIGSVIFKEIDAQNAAGFVYVNPEPKSDSVPESEKPVKFTVLYYQCY